ncbi:MAG: hypothetical protein L0241_06260, partial [Planctomycetia bacterium]|nr:hypothetical protein [Planctomycetia bacterium]
DGPADPQKFKEFADDWMRYMKSIPVASHDVPLVVPEPKSVDTVNPMTPIIPMPKGPVRPGG